MIRLCTNDDLPRLLTYFGEDYPKAIYLYIDLKRYGCETPNVSVFAAENDRGELTGLFLQYYDCLHCYSRDNDVDRAALLELIERQKPHTLFFCEELFNAIGVDFSDRYELHKVNLFRLKKTEVAEEFPFEFATPDDVPEIVDLLLTSEEYRKVYRREDAIAQIRERIEQGFSRSFILRQNGRIVFHAGTVAEAYPLVIGGLAILDESLRGKKLGRAMIAASANFALSLGLIEYSINMDESAKKMHLALGYDLVEHLIKLTKKDGE